VAPHRPAAARLRQVILEEEVIDAVDLVVKGAVGVIFVAGNVLVAVSWHRREHRTALLAAGPARTTNALRGVPVPRRRWSGGQKGQQEQHGHCRKSGRRLDSSAGSPLRLYCHAADMAAERWLFRQRLAVRWALPADVYSTGL